ncbi:MAG: HipA domain-containing protein [Candidatus Eremiobacterota bacterium]
MRRAERLRAQQAKQSPRTLFELDFLLMVDDETRQGALRFKAEADGPFLHPAGQGRIPPLVELPRLLSATDRFLAREDSAADLALLLAPGSSLGGARPKASVIDTDGQLALAKFPARQDDLPVVEWESVALRLAHEAGIAVPEWRRQEVAGKSVLLLRRFDRAPGIRIPYLSAMSMLGRRDNEPGNYLELADAIQQFGACPEHDLRALWRRIVFNVLISNTDDHLRNHGFLYHGAAGWTLSPAFDLNPIPTDVKPRVLSTAIAHDDPTASVELAMEVADYFRLSPRQARSIARDVGQAVTGWRSAASACGLARSDIQRMKSAFEHQDLRSVMQSRK